MSPLKPWRHGAAGDAGGDRPVGEAARQARLARWLGERSPVALGHAPPRRSWRALPRSCPSGRGPRPSPVGIRQRSDPAAHAILEPTAVETASAAFSEAHLVLARRPCMHDLRHVGQRPPLSARRHRAPHQRARQVAACSLAPEVGADTAGSSASSRPPGRRSRSMAPSRLASDRLAPCRPRFGKIGQLQPGARQVGALQ